MRSLAAQFFEAALGLWSREIRHDVHMMFFRTDMGLLERRGSFFNLQNHCRVKWTLHAQHSRPFD